MNFDALVRTAILTAFTETGIAPSPAGVAKRLGSNVTAVRRSWGRLRAGRVIVTGEDGESILMVHPFSGVPTEHTFESKGVRYYANCGWDALGIPAALGKNGVLGSRCGNSGEPLELEVADDGPEPCDWFFHSLVPAAHWWDDIVFT